MIRRRMSQGTCRTLGFALAPGPSTRCHVVQLQVAGGREGRCVEAGRLASSEFESARRNAEMSINDRLRDVARAAMILRDFAFGTRKNWGEKRWHVVQEGRARPRSKARGK